MSVDFDKIPEEVWQLFDEIMWADFENRGNKVVCTNRTSALISAWGWHPPLMKPGKESLLTWHGLAAYRWHKKQLKVNSVKQPAKRRGRPSKKETDREILVLSALVGHHKYESNGSIGNAEPVTVRGLADKHKPKLTTATISRFFKRKFANGHKGYVVACRKREIGRLLAKWQGDVSEGHLDLRSEESDRRDNN